MPVWIALFKKWYPQIAILSLFALVLTVTYCNGKSAGRQNEVVKQLKRENKIQTDIGKADSGASAERSKDIMKSTQQEKELNDALEATKDPDARRALRGCVILRQQGRDTSGIPACS